VKRAIQHDAVANVDVGTIERQRGVERRKRLRAKLRESPQIALHDVGLIGHRRRQRADPDAMREALKMG